jgi:hypothetical protein
MNKTLLLLALSITSFAASVEDIKTVHKKAYAKADGDAIKAITKELAKIKKDEDKIAFLELLKKIDPDNPACADVAAKKDEAVSAGDPYAAYKIPETEKEWEAINGKVIVLKYESLPMDMGINLKSGQKIAIIPNPEDGIKSDVKLSLYNYCGIPGSNNPTNPIAKKNAMCLIASNAASKKAGGGVIPIYENNIIEGPYQLTLGLNVSWYGPGNGEIRVKLVPVK